MANTVITDAINALENGGIVRVSLDKLQRQGNEKAAKYYKGEWTIKQVLENIVDEDPFTVTYFYDKLYVIHSKQDKFDIAAFLPPSARDTVFPTTRTGNTTALDDTNLNIIKSVFPELADWIARAIVAIPTASCASCDKNNYMYRLLRKIASLDNRNRVMDNIVPIFGSSFVAKLAQLTPVAYTTDSWDTGADTVRSPKAVTATPVPEQLAIYSATTTRGSSDPKSDVKELLGTAIVTLNESVTGFPAHRWLAIGYLSMAQDFAMSFNINFANILRAERLRLMKDESYIPDLLKYIEELEK